MVLWYYGTSETQHGPVQEQEIRNLLASGKINANTMVWRDGMSAWQPLNQVAEFSNPSMGGGSNPYGSPQSQTPYHNPYGQSPYQANRTNGVAIASMICGICSIPMIAACHTGILAAIAAVICGHISLKQIKLSTFPLGGRGMAIAGLCTGYFTIFLYVCLACFVVIAIASDM